MRFSDETVQSVRWQERALCQNANPEAYFPTGSAGATKRRCREECPVMAECLEFALANDAVGIWGGTGTKERRRIKAQRRREPGQVAVA